MWVHLHCLYFSSLIILSLLPFREQAHRCLQGHRVRAGPWWFNRAEVTGWWPEIKAGRWGAAQEGGPVRSGWIRLDQEPASGWGLRLHQERDGLWQVPGYAHLSPCTLSKQTLSCLVWFSCQRRSWVFYLCDLCSHGRVQASCRVLLSVTGRPPGRHFKTE